MADIVQLRDYWAREEAERARGLLEEQGIRCMVSSDDAGGLQPSIGFLNGYRVMIWHGDYLAADEVLRRAGL